MIRFNIKTGRIVGRCVTLEHWRHLRSLFVGWVKGRCRVSHLERSFVLVVRLVVKGIVNTMVRYDTIESINKGFRCICLEPGPKMICMTPKTRPKYQIACFCPISRRFPDWVDPSPGSKMTCMTPKTRPKYQIACLCPISRRSLYIRKLSVSTLVGDMERPSSFSLPRYFAPSKLVTKLKITRLSLVQMRPVEVHLLDL